LWTEKRPETGEETLNVAAFVRSSATGDLPAVEGGANSEREAAKYINLSSLAATFHPIELHYKQTL
jgi:hypothetical protein